MPTLLVNSGHAQLSVPHRSLVPMDEPLVQTVAGRPRARLSPLVTGYTGNRIEGGEPVCTAVLLSRHLAFISHARSRDHAQRPGSFTTLAG